MKERLRAALPYLGYVAFYLLTFALSAYLAFPYERLRDRIVAELSTPTKGARTKMQVEIDELGPHWFTGLSATGVRVIFSSANPRPSSASAEPEKPTVLELDEVHARFGLFAKLFGRTHVSYWARAFGGEIEGVYDDSEAERHVEAHVKDVLANRLEPAKALLGIPLQGTLQGTVDVTMPERKAHKASGSVALNLADLAVGDGEAKVLDTIALPKLNVGALDVEGEVKDGTLRVTKFGAGGQDIELAGEGKVSLRENLADSFADLYFRFKFSDTYRGKNDKTKALLGEPGSSTPPAFEFVPKVKTSKRSDGMYGWHLTGAFASPRFDPYSGTPPSSASGGGSGASPSTSDGSSGTGSGSSRRPPGVRSPKRDTEKRDADKREAE
ncbi:MAG TPA: type II secretion system protein GspN [Polyangiaceae bacterium]|nr:type II secretion system protein GspN [Polyangiaceae bacterium]